MNKKWDCYEIDENKVKELVEKYHLSNILAKILVNKGITKKEDINLTVNQKKLRLEAMQVNCLQQLKKMKR